MRKLVLDYYEVGNDNLPNGFKLRQEIEVPDGLKCETKNQILVEMYMRSLMGAMRLDERYGVG